MGQGLHPLCACIYLICLYSALKNLTFHSAQFLFYLHTSMNFSRKGLDSGLAHTWGGSCIPDLGGLASIRSHTFTSFVQQRTSVGIKLRTDKKKWLLLPVHLL